MVVDYFQTLTSSDIVALNMYLLPTTDEFKMTFFFLQAVEEEPIPTTWLQ